MKKIAVLAILLVALGAVVFIARRPEPLLAPSAPGGEARPVVATPPSAAGLIRVSRPLPGAAIASPLVIEGAARGTWFFEASFPIILTDWDGLIIAQGHAEAQADWMTENFVPFRAELEFAKPAYGERGTLILQKDNPSGEPEHDAALEIPVRFE